MRDGMTKKRESANSWTAAMMCGAALLLAGCGGSDDKAPLAPVDNSPSESIAGGGEPVSAVEDDTPPVQVQDPIPSPPPSAVPEVAAEGTFLDLETFPYGAIFSGGPPRDGIPALTNPPFTDASSASYLAEEDLVLGVVIGGEARAYPHNIGWWHEIVNDRVNGFPISVTFCPLTSTGLVFEALDDNGEQFELGVSGLLFNNNLIMYDRRDNNTLYPQIAYKGVEGSRRGERLKLMPVVETSWATWKLMHPNTMVVARGTYDLSRYSLYPYGDYRTNDDFFLFPLTTSLAQNSNFFTPQFRPKERVLGVRLEEEAKAYPFSTMGFQAVINDQVGGVDIVVAWDSEYDVAIPYAREVDGQILTFESDLTDSGLFNLRDLETNTLWDFTGRAIEGELVGKRLTQVPAHNSMWFAWVTFWQNTDVWQ